LGADQACHERDGAAERSDRPEAGVAREVPVFAHPGKPG
jgi:hypothetical protein